MALTSTTGAGAAFTPTEYAEQFFTHLHAQSVGLASGFRTVTTSATQLSVPRLNADAAANWTAEADEITVSDPDADEVVAVPRKVAALTYVSNEVVSDANPDVLDMLSQSMARAMSLKLDLGFFEGTGVAPQIRGLKNTTGVQTVSMGANGAALANLDPFADALGLLAEADAAGSAIVMHPRTWRALTKLKEQTSGHNKPLLAEHAASPAGPVGGGADAGRQSVGSIYGVPVWLSSQLSTTETQGTASAASSAYVYDAAQLVAVMRAGATITADTSAKFSSDQTAVRATMRADLVAPYPEAVTRIVGIVP
ncbi:MAG: phage major capsid protein [Pseudonocardiaceae bacterium]